MRRLRKTRTLSQADMARVLDISQQTYSKYESGLLQPPPEMQAHIAAVLGTSIDALWPTPQEALQ